MSANLELQDLSIAFLQKDGLLPAVDKLNFSLKPGETLALLGESGSGKSITALSLLRLLPNQTRYGQQSKILIDQADLLDLPEKWMRELRGKRIAMIFQEPMTALNPVLTVAQQLGEVLLQEKGYPRSQLEEDCLSLLRQVELPEPSMKLRQYPHQLSGGQKQRVLIAMALARNPEILVADEPTTALDVSVQAQILALLKKLQTQNNMSLLFITHDLALVEKMADKVALMYAGQIVEFARAQEFFQEAKHPYAQQLMASKPSFAKRGQSLQVIPGAVPSLDALPEGCRFHPRCAHAFATCAISAPELQKSSPEQQVRCHLYPEHRHLPKLPEKPRFWREAQEAKVCLLEVEDLSLIYQQQRAWWQRSRQHKVVDGLSFKLYAGKTLALVGESGCGKTSTARAILGLQAIQAGAIRYRGRQLRDFGRKELRQFRRAVQIVFQDPFSSMNPRMTVAEILAEGMQWLSLSKQAKQQRQEDLLDQVGLSKKSLERYPHQFSGGQRQRIAIARALASEPELIICDEPTSALDVSVQAQIVNLLKSLQEDRGLSYLFISHNLPLVSYFADEILVMQAGKALEQGSCERIVQQPQELYTQKLLSLS